MNCCAGLLRQSVGGVGGAAPRPKALGNVTNAGPWSHGLAQNKKEAPLPVTKRVNVVKNALVCWYSIDDSDVQG
jgi:hypothetical protein